MTIQELIDILNKQENKSMPVMVSDYLSDPESITSTEIIECLADEIDGKPNSFYQEDDEIDVKDILKGNFKPVKVLFLMCENA